MNNAALPSMTPNTGAARARPLALMGVAALIFLMACLDQWLLSQGSGGTLVTWLAADNTSLSNPGRWWQLLAYGFVHDVSGPVHLAMNLFGLALFGPAVEQRLGHVGFLAFFLAALVFAGSVGLLTFSWNGQASGVVVGASGAVVATAVLNACFAPRYRLYLFLVVPLPTSVLVALIVMFDVAGVMGLLEGLGDIVSGVSAAHTVHLSGTLFAVLVFFANARVAANRRVTTYA